jgi:hypothetical protein
LSQDLALGANANAHSDLNARFDAIEQATPPSQGNFQCPDPLNLNNQPPIANPHASH